MMRPIDHSQIEIMAQVHEFKKECEGHGLQIDQGQAYECQLQTDPVSKVRLARRFHHQNIRNDHSAGEVHFSSDEDDFFDIPAPNPDEEPEDTEKKLHEIMMMCPIRHREKIIRVLLEMKQVGSETSITSATSAVGVPRSSFYKMICKIRRWVARPPTPEGWSGTDCSALVQLDLDLGVPE